MFVIKHSDQFLTTPWKNGGGVTTELAINEGGELDNFDWRLSMASVKQDGAFSNFTGYQRQLLLLSGNGITLTHKCAETEKLLATDTLLNTFDCSAFDGGSATFGKLVDGEIIDFNIIARQNKINAKVTTIVDTVERQTIYIDSQAMVFVYCHRGNAHLVINNEQPASITIEQGALFEWRSDEHKQLNVSGDQVIVIEIENR